MQNLDPATRKSDIKILFFIYSVSAILLITSLAKFYSLTGKAQILQAADPILLLKNSHILFGVGVIEWCISLFLILGRQPSVKLASIAWLGMNFLAYRLAMWIERPGSPCPCLGNITGKLHIKPSAVAPIVLLISLYMVLGSLYFLVKNRLAKRQPIGVLRGSI